MRFSVFLSPAMDIKIKLGRAADHITEHSKNVMTTMGEWELLEITAHKQNQGHDDGAYVDELAFHVG